MMDSHVIRDEIENESHIGLGERLAQAPQSLFSAELRVNGGMIDHVIAVRAAGARFEKRRGIHMNP